MRHIANRITCPEIEPMDSSPAPKINQREVATDLKAAVGARRELDDDMEDHVLEAFLARVDQRITERVDQQVAQHAFAATPAKKTDQDGQGHRGSDAWVLPASLGACIPLIAIAGGIAGGVGIIAVMAAVVILVASYLASRGGR
jgi:hypothetical protein